MAVFPLSRGENKFRIRNLFGVCCIITFIIMPRKIIPYKPHLKELARKLRNNSTYAEVLLWKQVSGKQMLGYDFHRQKPLLKYIVDFFCSELMLAIEIDGLTHFDEEAIKRDEKRQKALEQVGVRFLRFDDAQVRNDIVNVLREIEFWILNEKEKKE